MSKKKISLALFGRAPFPSLVMGYLIILLIGFGLLSLSFLHEQALPWLDNLFIATSALSTTGLATIDVAGSYNFFGELVILLLIQLGGVGYMSIGSFITLLRKRKLNQTERNLLSNDFSLPAHFNLTRFIKSLILFSLLFELIGAIGLSIIFYQNGETNFIWKGIFHSISAFCTAGFSLLPDSFESYQDHWGLNLIISILSIAGALGFIVFTDIYDRFSGRKAKMTFTSKIILRFTFSGILLGAFVLFLFEDSYADLGLGDRILVSIFQSMTAFTTVGFNSSDIGVLAAAPLFFMLLLMTVGASPAGTGGGVKSTTITALFSQLRCTLKRHKNAAFLGRAIPEHRIRTASSNFFFYIIVIGMGTFSLLVVEEGDVFKILFEAISALGTVGLSMGITGELGNASKIIIILLMFLGRIGPLSVGISLFKSTDREQKKREADIVI